MFLVHLPVHVTVLVFVSLVGALPVFSAPVAPWRVIVGAGIVGYLPVVVAVFRWVYSSFIFVASAPVGRLIWKFVSVMVEGLGCVPPFLLIVFVSAYPLSVLRVTMIQVASSSHTRWYSMSVLRNGSDGRLWQSMKLLSLHRSHPLTSQVHPLL